MFIMLTRLVYFALKNKFAYLKKKKVTLLLFTFKYFGPCGLKRIHKGDLKVKKSEVKLAASTDKYFVRFEKIGLRKMLRHICLSKDLTWNHRCRSKCFAFSLTDNQFYRETNWPKAPKNIPEFYFWEATLNVAKKFLNIESKSFWTWYNLANWLKLL